MDTTLYVGNLPESTTETELEALFTQIGDVISLRILRDRSTGQSRGFGYLTMSAQSEADRAVSRLNDYLLRDRRLKVSLTKHRAVSGLTGARFEP